MHAGKMITLTLTLLVLLPVVTACHTVEGFGEDLEGLGESLQSSSAAENSRSATRQGRDSNNGRFDQWQKPASKQRHAR
jgi:predicted small secreted protein